jgi:hypothetical protein
VTPRDAHPDHETVRGVLACRARARRLWEHIAAVGRAAEDAGGAPPC